MDNLGNGHLPSPGPNRRSSLLIRLVILVVITLGVRAGAAVRVQQTTTAPFRGITFIDRVEQGPRPLHMRLVQIDLEAPGIRFKVSPPGGPREVVRETTLEFLRHEGAQVAINAHFFLPFPSTDLNADVIGIAASGGAVYSGFETPAQNYALVSDAPGINIDSRNRARLIHRNATQADARAVLEPETLWNVVAGSAQILTDGEITMPRYKDASHGDAALTPGGPGQYSNDRSWYDAVNARTAIGLSRDRQTMTLFTVDARGGSAGLSVREMAQRLRDDHGVWNALNLDGGGSTTLAMQDPQTDSASVINTSSDNPGGRAVASSLAVFASKK